MNFESLLTSILPEHRESFLRFAETGEAPQAFLDYLDADRACQQALEEVLEIQSSGFRGLAAGLHADWERLQERGSAVTVEPQALESRLAGAIGELADAEPERRAQVVAGTTQLLRRDGRPDPMALSMLGQLSAIIARR